MITGLRILHNEPLLGGVSFGSSGSYLLISGVATGEVDPLAIANRSIAAIGRAPLNARGRVEYRTPFVILRPADAARGNGCLLHEVTNRGKVLMFSYCFGASAQSNLFERMEHLGSALPLQSGYSLLWCGWDAGAPSDARTRAPRGAESGCRAAAVTR